MKKSENTKSLVNVALVLDTIKLDSEKFEVIRCYDNEEFLTVKKERKEYANIREVITKRSVVKLWGHKQFVTVEASKMLRKKVDFINVDKKMYIEKEKDKNNNYICKTVKEATALTNDFTSQVAKMIEATTTVEVKKEVEEVAK